ncbi:MAG TPA: hypothetical protein VIH16_11040 [Bellilinea sp.]
MKLTAKPLAVILFVILFGSIIFTTAMNWWQTESQKVPATFTEGEAAGEYNPADIRGSYTFQDIENSFKVPVEDLAKAFAIPADRDAAAYAIKDLETLYAVQAEAGTEIGTGSVRYFTALYTGLPYELVEETFLPAPAVELLKSKATLTVEQLAYLEAHSIALEVPMTTLTQVPTEEVKLEEENTDTILKGKTTFQELLDWGVSPEFIVSTIGAAIPAPGVKVKDYCTEANLNFEEIKVVLQAEIDRLNP